MNAEKMSVDLFQYAYTNKISFYLDFRLTFLFSS